MNELEGVNVIFDKIYENTYQVHTIYRKIPEDLKNRVEKIDGVSEVTIYSYYMTVTVGRCFDCGKVKDQIKKAVQKYVLENRDL